LLSEADIEGPIGDLCRAKMRTNARAVNRLHNRYGAANHPGCVNRG
jgi:hypothetical protein